MFRIILITIVVFFSLIPVHAQNTIDFATIDAKTYQHYLTGNWDSVIYYGKQGLCNKIDYFYLRVRLGAAYYYKQNYSKAIDEFEIAIKYNSTDTYTQTMLYFSYLFTGRESDARYFGAGMTEEAKKGAGFKKTDFLNNIYVEGGMAVNDNLQKNKNTAFYRNEKKYGEMDLSGNTQNEHLGLKHNLGKRFSIYQGISLIKENHEKIIQNTTHHLNGINITQKDTSYYVPPPPAGGHYNYDTIIIHSPKIAPFDTTSVYKNVLNQFEYYINCRMLLTKSLTITPFFHLINVRHTTQNASRQKMDYNYTDTVFIHTQIVVPNPFPPPMFVIKDTLLINYNNHIITTDKYNYTLSDTTFNNYVFGLSLNKDIRNFNVSIFGTFSNLNDQSQKEAGFGITWLPEGNFNLYGNTTVTAFRQNSEKIKWITDISVGMKILPKFWLESFGTFGEMTNFSEKNGFVVHNNPDRITFRCGLSPIFVFKHFDISVHYQFQAKEGSYITRISAENYIVQKIKYQNHLIIGGIKWKL